MKEGNFLKRRKETTESAVKSSFGKARNELNFFEGTIDERREQRRRRKRDTR